MMQNPIDAFKITLYDTKHTNNTNKHLQQIQTFPNISTISKTHIFKQKS